MNRAGRRRLYRYSAAPATGVGNQTGTGIGLNRALGTGARKWRSSRLLRSGVWIGRGTSRMSGNYTIHL